RTKRFFLSIKGNEHIPQLIIIPSRLARFCKNLFGSSKCICSLYIVSRFLSMEDVRENKIFALLWLTGGWVNLKSMIEYYQSFLIVSQRHERPSFFHMRFD